MHILARAQKQENNDGLIVGLAIGLGIGIPCFLTMAILFWLFLRHRRLSREEDARHEQIDVEGDVTLHEDILVAEFGDEKMPQPRYVADDSSSYLYSPFIDRPGNENYSTDSFARSMTAVLGPSPYHPSSERGDSESTLSVPSMWHQPTRRPPYMWGGESRSGAPSVTSFSSLRSMPSMPGSAGGEKVVSEHSMRPISPSHSHIIASSRRDAGRGALNDGHEDDDDEEDDSDGDDVHAGSTSSNLNDDTGNDDDDTDTLPLPLDGPEQHRISAVIRTRTPPPVTSGPNSPASQARRATFAFEADERESRGSIYSESSLQNSGSNMQHKIPQIAPGARGTAHPPAVPPPRSSQIMSWSDQRPQSSTDLFAKHDAADKQEPATQEARSERQPVAKPIAAPVAAPVAAPIAAPVAVPIAERAGAPATKSPTKPGADTLGPDDSFDFNHPFYHPENSQPEPRQDPSDQQRAAKPESDPRQAYPLQQQYQQHLMTHGAANGEPTMQQSPERPAQKPQHHQGSPRVLAPHQAMQKASPVPAATPQSFSSDGFYGIPPTSPAGSEVYPESSVSNHGYLPAFMPPYPPPNALWEPPARSDYMDLPDVPMATGQRMRSSSLSSIAKAAVGAQPLHPRPGGLPVMDDSVFMKPVKRFGDRRH